MRELDIPPLDGFLEMITAGSVKLMLLN